MGKEPITFKSLVSKHGIPHEPKPEPTLEELLCRVKFCMEQFMEFYKEALDLFEHQKPDDIEYCSSVRSIMRKMSCHEQLDESLELTADVVNLDLLGSLKDDVLTSLKDYKERIKPFFEDLLK